MNENDDLRDIPPLVPDRDDVDTHISNRRAQQQQIARPSYHVEKVRVSTWPVRIMLILLTLGMGGAGYGAYYFYGQYQYQMRQTELRIGDLEARLMLTSENAEETDSDLMERINRSIEQYDLLWANWRQGNAKFDDIQGSIANLTRDIQGQGELVAQNTQAISTANQSLTSNQARLNAVTNDLNIAKESVAELDQEMNDLAAMGADLESIRQSLNSGDSTVLGLIGRIEYMEQSMESVNAHRLQINESLLRLREDVQSLQRNSGAGSN